MPATTTSKATRKKRNAADPAVGIGTKFRAVYADSNALWTVTRILRSGVVHATITDEDGGADYVGVDRLFAHEEVIRSIQMDRYFAERGSSSDAWYASLTPGQIVHYCNGFKEYVRCVAEMHEGKMQLRPIALVGEWKEWGLPRRRPDGSVDLPYHAKMIQEGNHWRANTSCVYESHDCVSQYKSLDPRGLTPIDLTPPPIVDETRAALVRAADVARDALVLWRDQNAIEPEVALREAFDIIQKALTATTRRT